MDSKDLFIEGQQLFVQGKHKESIDAFSRALEAGYDPVITLLSRGVAHLRLSENDEAIKDFSSAIDADGKHNRAYYYRGVAHMNKEDYKHAVDDFSRAIELKSDFGPAFFVRGLAEAQLGQEDQAMDDFHQAVKLSESWLQEFADFHNVLYTRFDRALALINGEMGPVAGRISEDDIEKLKVWMGD